jgi:hypothetical protein
LTDYIYFQYIAKKIYEINERGNYEDPATLSSTDPAKNKKLLEQDEEIFQTARLCNIAWFGSIVFSDYFSSILGLVRQGSTWSLNPFEVGPLSVYLDLLTQIYHRKSGTRIILSSSVVGATSAVWR